MGCIVSDRCSGWGIRCRGCRLFVVDADAYYRSDFATILFVDCDSAFLQRPRHNVAGEPALAADPPESLPLPAETIRLHPPQRPKPPPRAQQQHGARHGLPTLPLRIVLHRQPLPRLLTHLCVLPCQRQWRRQRQR